MHCMKKKAYIQDKERWYHMDKVMRGMWADLQKWMLRNTVSWQTYHKAFSPASKDERWWSVISQTLNLIVKENKRERKMANNDSLAWLC